MIGIDMHMCRGKRDMYRYFVTWSVIVGPYMFYWSFFS